MHNAVQIHARMTRTALHTSYLTQYEGKQPKGESSRRGMFGEDCSEGNFREGNFRRGIFGGECSEGNFREGNFRRVIFGGEFSEGNLRRGIFAGGKVRKFASFSLKNLEQTVAQADQIW